VSTIDNISRIQKKHEKDLLRKENVVGVGIGKKNMTGDLCIVVYVVKKVPENQLDASEIIPRSIEGVKTDVFESGRFRSLNNDR
jgi:hypothetical protein